MLLSMLVKLYNQQQQQQQLELEQQQQQPQAPDAQQLARREPAHGQPNEPGAHQPDEHTLAAVIAAKQLLQLHQFGRHQPDRPGAKGADQRPPARHQPAASLARAQQPLHQLNQQLALAAHHHHHHQHHQQTQPFDLSIKSAGSSDSSLNNSTGTANNSPDHHHHHQLAAGQHFQMQLQAAASMGLARHQLGSPLDSASRHSDELANDDHHLDDDLDDQLVDEQLDEQPNSDLHRQHHRRHLLDHATHDRHHHRHLDDELANSMPNDDDSLDLVKRHHLATTPLGQLHQHTGMEEEQAEMQKAVFKPQPFKIIRDKDNNFSCQYCSKKYQSMGALKMHVRTHTLPCQCKICGKSFSRPWLLQGHIRTHTGEKPFKCDQCHRAFADRSNLRAHLQTHAKVKKYSCKCCLKTFSRMSLQVKHEEHCNNNVNHPTQTTTVHNNSATSNVDKVTNEMLMAPATTVA